MTDADRWDSYCNATWVDPKDGKTKLTGNAEFAREVRATPLEADAILNLVWDNIGCFGDGYYNVLTTPIEMRVQEYLNQRG